jgi:16S rRNA C1402 N4-methylase RsmH
MLVKARMRLGNHVEIVNQSYDSIGCYLQQHQLSADFVLLDLGVNMEHYKNHER